MVKPSRARCVRNASIWISSVTFLLVESRWTSVLLPWPLMVFWVSLHFKDLSWIWNMATLSRNSWAVKGSDWKWKGSVQKTPAKTVALASFWTANHTATAQPLDMLASYVLKVREYFPASHWSLQIQRVNLSLSRALTEVLSLLVAIRGTKVPPFFFQLEVMKWEQVENMSNCKKSFLKGGYICTMSRFSSATY